MKIGTFMMPLHPPAKDRMQTFEEDTECIILADELGFSEAWIGQHNTIRRRGSLSLPTTCSSPTCCRRRRISAWAQV